MLKFKKLTETATIPTRGSVQAAGLDLYADETAVIHPGCRHVVRTGIAMQSPDGYFGSIRPRSGLAVKHGIDTLAGVIDSDYTGEVMVALINHGSFSFNINRGDRIAQVIIQPHGSDFPSSVVGSFDETGRGDNGFGSTGA